MADTKISCPHCGGHILYPNDLAGRSVPCPHCHVAFILPKPKSVVPVIIVAVLVAAVFGLASLLVFQIHSRNNQPPANPSVRPPATTAASGPQPSLFVPQTVDDQDIARLCKEYSDAQASRDTNAVYALFSEFSKTNLTLQDLSIDGAIYDFEKLESIRYRNGALGKSALAKVKRKTQTSGGATQESVRELDFVKDAGGWRLFPVLDLARKILGEYAASGFSDPLDSDLQLLRNGDAFNTWDQNNTNAFEAAFKLAQHRDGIFPWNLEFSVESNHLDNLILIVNYRLRNNSAITWIAPLLEFHLDQGAQTRLTADDILPNVRSGESVQRSVSFLFSSAPLESAQYALDVSCPLGSQRQLPLVQSVPVEVTVQQLATAARLEVVGTRFDLFTNENSPPVLSARIDFRAKNTGSEPIPNLEVQCFWYSTNGDPLNQTTDYLIGDADAPLGTGQSKTGILRCGKGEPTVKVPVLADIYLQSGGRRTLVQKGLLVQ
jgi:hypothetical protein